MTARINDKRVIERDTVPLMGLVGRWKTQFQPSKVSNVPKFFAVSTYLVFNFP